MFVAGKVATTLFELMSDSSVRYNNRHFIRHLYKQFQDVSEDAFPLNQHPSTAPLPVDEEAMFTKLVADGLQKREVRLGGVSWGWVASREAGWCLARLGVVWRGWVSSREAELFFSVKQDLLFIALKLFVTLV